MSHRFIALVVSVFTVWMGGFAAAQCGVGWTLGAGAGPGGYEICYDEARGKTVLFSGGDRKTMEWNGVAWSVVAEGGPPDRGAGAMVYDSVGQRCLLFGGYSSAGVRKDLWAWNGATWTQLSAGPSDGSGRGDFAMSFDRDRNRLVVHGGYQGSGGSLLEDTLEWNPTTNTWTRWATSPIGRLYAHRMAYDEARHETILHGGFYYTNQNKTWKWDGSSWTAAGTSGPARYVFGMTYDSARSQLILHGGTTCCGEVEYPQTYAWNGTAWALCSLQGPARGYMNIAYDRVRDAIVMPGGMGPTPTGRAYIPETWELAMSDQPSTLRVPAKYPTIQSAVDAAAAGDTVLVAPGVYVESVNLHGKAILLKSEVRGEAAINAPEAGRSIIASTSESASTRVIGFVLSRSGQVGGGVTTVGSSPVFDSCVIQGCRNGLGGGAHVEGGSPSFIACDFVDCYAWQVSGYYGDGGAIRSVGGSVIIDYCSFRECVGPPHGHVLVQENGGSTFIRHSTIIGAEATKGFSQIYNAAGSVTIEDSTFDSVADGTVLFGWAPFTVRRCNFRNCNGSRVIEVRFGQTMLDACAFENCHTTGALFGVIYSGTYALGQSSFCNVSSPMFQGAWTDLGGNDFNAPCSCFGDLTADGAVNGSDLAIMLVGWGSAPGQSQGDLSGDGDIDGTDISLLLLNWGVCAD